MLPAGTIGAVFLSRPELATVDADLLDEDAMQTSAHSYPLTTRPATSVAKAKKAVKKPHGGSVV